MTKRIDDKIVVRPGGTQDFGDWHMGAEVTTIAQLSVGLHLVSENKQFDATNLCEVVKVDVARGIAHAKFIDPLNPCMLRIGANSDGFAIWDHDLQSQSNSYSLATLSPRKMLDTQVRATHVEATGPRNNPKNFDLSEWDQIDDTWWYRKSGDIEIHLSSDPGLSWEVSQMRQGGNIVDPLYIPNFDDAIAEATRLFEVHKNARSSLVPRQ